MQSLGLFLVTATGGDGYILHKASGGDVLINISILRNIIGNARRVHRSNAGHQRRDNVPRTDWIDVRGSGRVVDSAYARTKQVFECTMLFLLLLLLL
jgi:hypothetical protein